MEMKIDMVDYQELLCGRTDYANLIIEKYLPKEEGFLTELISAMNYSVLVGGKRLRPVFMDSVYRLMGGKDKRNEPFMAAMEYLHTYSLVHDDMPEIDNDELRRGKPTTHSRYGAACGLLAGDGLLHWSTQTALRAFDYAGSDEDRRNIVKALTVFAEKSGPYGMLGGQSVDVLFTGKNPDKDRLDYIYRLKTCALIEGSMMIGAALAGADESTLEKLEEIGRCVGMAFQIQDDILDVTGDAEVIGKPVLSDEKNNKTTYVTLYGMDKAVSDVAELSNEAVDIICSIGGEGFLADLVKYMIHRNN